MIPGNTSRRFGLRFGEGSLIPVVEITVTEFRPDGSEQTVVARRWGLTRSRAMVRAQEWTRAHGDPR